jgi:hypothetical protein
MRDDLRRMAATTLAAAIRQGRVSVAPWSGHRPEP